MAYVDCTYKSPNFIEHEVYFAGKYGAKGEKRAKKEKATPLEIKKNNQWNRIKRLRRTLQLNFYAGDYWVTFKYKSGTRKDIKSVKMDIKKCLDGLRKKYKAKGAPLMFVYRIEIGKRGGLHCHMVINRITDGDLLIREAWKKATEDAGSIDYTTIEESGGFGGLAEYICKLPDDQIPGQMYFDILDNDMKKIIAISSSRNLKRPEPVKREYSHWTIKRILSGENKIKPAAGFYIDKNSIKRGINKFTGLSYLYYTEIRIKKVKRESYG